MSVTTKNADARRESERVTTRKRVKERKRERAASCNVDDNVFVVLLFQI